ncbi:MAG TPA: DUF5663 domain-containing protein [Verrucomicrobiae bacterium]|nr:DUF5663 domain-containing protein [Verrucomicrobiae bacterium]
MFRLDDDFLDSLGLGAMPKEEKVLFLQHLREELELRVGTKLAEGLSDAQLAEFEGIIDRRQGKIDEWLAANVPAYANDPAYVSMLQNAVAKKQGNPLEPSEIEAIRAEFTATKWLETNRSEYRQVVANTIEQLRQEIMNNRESFLAA